MSNVLLNYSVRGGVLHGEPVLLQREPVQLQQCAPPDHREGGLRQYHEGGATVILPRPLTPCHCYCIDDFLHKILAWIQYYLRQQHTIPHMTTWRLD